MKSKGNVYQALDVRNGQLEFFSSSKGALELFTNRYPKANVSIISSKLWQKICDRFDFSKFDIDNFQFDLMDEQAETAENMYLDGV
ncbi:hypothetical protein LFYK43_16790 [Ligilactobacillus salitolerans]|uniref:Uncharacterized protein n=1 Tax=Ligilactobacillus salitolerans TaxID=1808352 RepID=A0A401IUJ0_9LACO|nr:hypothetical protein [Ligilactobacillus salitolerans]GBG95220.1 hypothetical protein LFYK43_16790 [Ligilactobacillus salitolerans]